MARKYYAYNNIRYIFWMPSFTHLTKHDILIVSSGDVLIYSSENMDAMGIRKDAYLKCMIEEGDLDFIYQFYYD